MQTVSLMVGPLVAILDDYNKGKDPAYLERAFMFNPVTPRSDLHATSPNNIHTLSNKQVMRLLKLIS